MKQSEKANCSLAQVDYTNSIEFPSGLSKIPAIPIKQLGNSELTDEHLKAEISSDMYIKQQTNKHGQAKSFNLKSIESNNLVRSKSPSFKIQSSEKYFIEPKRSKTPTPESTFGRQSTDQSFMKPLVLYLNLTHKKIPLSTFHTHTTDIAHVESLSRNVNAFSKGIRHPEFHEHRSFSKLDPISRAVPGAIRCKTPEPIKPESKTLLLQREKRNNTLTGRGNSRNHSERERPKSAMSMRSAPWSTKQERVLKRHGRTGAIHDTFEQYREKTIHHYPPEISDYGCSMSTGSGDNVHILGAELNQAALDSEIEHFLGKSQCRDITILP